MSSCDLLTVVPSFIFSRTETITSNFFRRACDFIRSGARVSGPAWHLRPNLRDRCGFCYIGQMDIGSSYYTGFTDNHHRPGILVQKTEKLEFPKGNKSIILPSKTKMTFADGSFFIDAEDFNERMIGQSLLVEIRD